MIHPTVRWRSTTLYCILGPTRPSGPRPRFTIMPGIFAFFAVAGLMAAASPVMAQTASPYFVQGLFGAAFRDVGLIGSNHGVFFLGRGGVRLSRNLGVIGEASVSRYPRRDLGFPDCGRYDCASADFVTSTPGLAVMGLAVGLQPRVQLGAVSLMASGTIGAYAPYNSVPMFPNVKAGLHASVGAGLPIGSRFEALLEVGGTHYLNHFSRQTDGLSFNLGFAIN